MLAALKKIADVNNMNPLLFAPCWFSLSFLSSDNTVIRAPKKGSDICQLVNTSGTCGRKFSKAITV